MRRGSLFMNDYIAEYCVGCGLCESLNICKLYADEKGFVHPVLNKEAYEKLCMLCPSAGVQLNEMDTDKVWGRDIGVYYGWSLNEYIRNKASSGGILSELAIYLLQSKKVDAIIQTCADPNDPVKTITCCNVTKEQVINACGSRYSISHPLGIINKLDLNKKYAFIGKPCDVTALSNYLACEPELKDVFPYKLSFFCAGMPSDIAQNILLDKLGCVNCTELSYRGNGWPGYTTAKDKEGNEYRINYISSWGKILGRDIAKVCRFCIDGIGEMADVSAADAWYLNELGEPDFSEHEGRNLIFARTAVGLELIREARDAKCIELQKCDNKYLKEFSMVQKHQFVRKTTMYPKIIALKVFHRARPAYNRSILKKYMCFSSPKMIIKTFAGTVKRILNGKI